LGLSYARNAGVIGTTPILYYLVRTIDTKGTVTTTKKNLRTSDPSSDLLTCLETHLAESLPFSGASYCVSAGTEGLILAFWITSADFPIVNEEVKDVCKVFLMYWLAHHEKR
jgi:hypothetical protein